MLNTSVRSALFFPSVGRALVYLTTMYPDYIYMDVTRTLIGEGGGEGVFIYSYSARRVSFQKKSVGQDMNI